MNIHSELLQGHIFPTRYEETSSYVIFPINVPNTGDTSIDVNSDFRLICQAILIDSPTYTLTTDSKKHVGVLINDTQFDAYMLPEGSRIDTKDNIFTFQNEGMYLIVYVSKKLYLLPLGGLSNVLHSSDTYIFKDDIALEGSDITLRELIKLVKRIESTTDSSVTVDKDGNIIVSGDIQTTDKISLRDLNDSILSLQSTFDTYKNTVEALESANSDILEVADRLRELSDNMVSYRDEYIVDTYDVIFQADSAFQSLSSFYTQINLAKQSLENAIEGIQSWQDDKDTTISDLSTKVDESANSIATLTDTTIPDITSRLSELEDTQVDTSKFVPLNSSGDADVANDVIFNGQSVQFINPPIDGGFTSDYPQYEYCRERQSLVSVLNKITSQISRVQSELSALSQDIGESADEYDSYDWPDTGTHKLTYKDNIITGEDYHIYLCNMKYYTTTSATPWHELSFILSRGGMTLLSNISSDNSELTTIFATNSTIEGTRIIPEITSSISDKISICSSDESIWFSCRAEVKVKQIL